MGNKTKYENFCKEVYVPIYSKSWWLDAVCGSNNWDVWIYENDNGVIAAMPYYHTERNGFKYITKPPLTQNNGIIFNYPPKAKFVKQQEIQEKVIDEACKYIASLNVDVYEQQFHYEFTNWLPFFWNRYKAITRYTYVIDNPKDIEKTWNNVSSKTRAIIKKGYRNASFDTEISIDEFYAEHEKVFLKQGLQCPFSYELFRKLVEACVNNNSGKLMCARTPDGKVMSVLFLVWDSKSSYQLLGGSMPEYQKYDTYSALTWEAIMYSGKLGLKYDFEGSVIKRISKAFREFGGIPRPYFRIRKVFNPIIVRKETEQMILDDGLEKKRRID